MEFSCSKQELVEIINIVQRAVSAKSTMAILECIKIECNANGTVIFCGNNSELYIEYTAHLNVFEGGSISLASKMFGEIIRRLPDGTVNLRVNEDDNITKIKCGISEFNIVGVASSEFPSPPVIEEKCRFSMNERLLRDVIKKTISFTAANDSKRQFLTGVLFSCKNNKMSFVSTDSHRLAVVQEDLIDDVKDFKIIVPGATLRELLKIIEEKDELLKISFSENTIIFDFNDFKMYSRLIEGEYLKYESLLNVNNNRSVIVNNAKLRAGLERAYLLINEDGASFENRVPVRLTFGFGKIEINCKTKKGKINEELEAQMEGEELLIGLNCKFLLEALSSCDDEEVLIELSSPLAACYIKSPNDGNYMFFILPVRLYD